MAHRCEREDMMRQHIYQVEQDHLIMEAFESMFKAVGVDAADAVSHQVISALQVLATCCDIEDQFRRSYFLYRRRSGENPSS